MIISKNQFEMLIDGRCVPVYKEDNIQLDESISYNALIAIIKDKQHKKLLESLKSQVTNQ